MPTVTVIQPKATDNEQRLLRIAAYCRVSSSSDDQLNSYNSQLTYYTHKFEDSETETLIDIYADEGITGTSTEKRTEFLRLIDDCRKGKIDRIYTKSISRFARNTRDCLKNIRELKSLGITILFEKENIDTANINDELMITIMGGLAQEESVSISRNVKWSMQRRIRNGNYTPNSAPFGYIINEKRFVVNDKEAHIVRNIFEYYINGHGVQSTTDYINQLYQITPPLAFSSVRYILENEKYIGDSIYQKSFTIDAICKKRSINKGELPKFYLEQTHEPIISKQLYDIVQDKINNNSCSAQKMNSVFNKHIVCGKCGGFYKLKKCNNTVYWLCRKHDIQANKCHSRRIQEGDIKDAFIRLFNKLFVGYSKLLLPLKESLLQLRMHNCTGDKNIIELRKLVFQNKEQLNVISSLHTKGFLSDVKYTEQTMELKSRISKYNKQIDLISSLNDYGVKDIELLIDFFEKRKQLMIDFESQVFEFLIDKIVVNGYKLEFKILEYLKLEEGLN